MLARFVNVRRHGGEGREAAGVELAASATSVRRFDLSSPNRALNSTSMISGRISVKNSAIGMRMNISELIADLAHEQAGAARPLAHGPIRRRSTVASDRRRRDPRNTSSSVGRSPTARRARAPRATAQPVTACDRRRRRRRSMNSTRPPTTDASAGNTSASSPTAIAVGQRRTTPRCSASARISSVGRALGDQPSGLQHADPVGEVLGLVEVVRWSAAPSCPRPHRLGDQLPRLAAGGGIEAGRRLVEEQQLGSPTMPRARSSRRRCPPDSVPTRCVGLVVEADQLDAPRRRRGDGGSTTRTARSPRATVSSCSIPGRLQHDPDPIAERRVRRRAGRRRAPRPHRRCASRWPSRISTVVDLPAPLCPSRAYTSPASDVERQAVDGVDRPVRLAQPRTSMAATACEATARRTRRRDRQPGVVAHVLGGRARSRPSARRRSPVGHGRAHDLRRPRPPCGQPVVALRRADP